MKRDDGPLLDREDPASYNVSVNVSVRGLMSDAPIKFDAELDLRGVVCPYNYLKTKLKLEEMDPGQTLAVHLDDGESIRNVPRSVKEEGHNILKIENTGTGFLVVIEKCGE